MILRRRAILLIAGVFAGCAPEPPDLYAPPRPLVKFDRIPEPEKPPPPRIPAPRMSPEDAGVLMQTIFKLYLQSFGGPAVGCTEGDPELHWEIKHYLLEARLFAKAHPKVALEFALRILEDADADEISLRFVVEFLGPIHRQFDRRMEDAIVELADHSDDLISSWAIAVLGSSGLRSRYRYHLWSFCSKGKKAAYDCISWDDHPDTFQFLGDLRGKRGGGWCDTAIARLRILRSPDWKEQVEKLLRGPECPDYYWAAGVARERLPDLLRGALRRKVDEIRKRYDPLLAACDGSLNPDDPDDPKNFAYQFVHSVRVPGMDLDYLLIDFNAVGGELTPVEARRLHHFGFLGDPEERLLEILRRRGHSW